MQETRPDATSVMTIMVAMGILTIMEKKEYRNSTDENMLVDFECVYRHRQVSLQKYLNRKTPAPYGFFIYHHN
jgi:hypothetical protein